VFGQPKTNQMLSGHGMNSGHQTLNDAKPIIDNLKGTNISAYDYTIWVFKLSNTSCNKKHLSKRSRQLVVQLVLETMVMFDLYSFSLTPMTNMVMSDLHFLQRSGPKKPS
jgi:hypothetical protein